MNKLLRFAEGIVREAGSIVKGASNHSEVLRSKEGGDLVTEGDLLVERQILDSIAGSYPDHGFISEERGAYQADADYIWVLDPIDGTKYFARGIPLYSISLALQFKGEPVIGIVYSPEPEQMFCASVGAGTTLNGRSIHCSHTKEPADAIVCAEIPNKHSPVVERNRSFDQLRLLIDNAWKVRLIHVASLGLSWCAMGGFDAYVSLHSGAKLWDIAAGQVILTEAGGQFSNNRGWIVAGPPLLHDKLIDLLGPTEL